MNAQMRAGELDFLDADELINARAIRTKKPRVKP
jgi:hypothetical protein